MPRALWSSPKDIPSEEAAETVKAVVEEYGGEKHDKKALAYVLQIIGNNLLLGLTIAVDFADFTGKTVKQITIIICTGMISSYELIKENKTQKEENDQPK